MLKDSLEVRRCFRQIQRRLQVLTTPLSGLGNDEYGDSTENRHTSAPNGGYSRGMHAGLPLRRPRAEPHTAPHLSRWESSAAQQTRRSAAQCARYSEQQDPGRGAGYLNSRSRLRM